MNIFITIGLNCVILFLMYKFLSVRLDRRIATAEVLDEMKREVGTIITELNETTDRNIELFETRIVQLKETIEQADRRLGLLKRENEKNAVVNELDSRIVSKSGTPTNVPATPERADQSVGNAPEENVPSERITSGGFASTQSVRYEAAQKQANPRPESPARRSSPQQQTGDRPKPAREAPNRERILDFHRQGFASAVIAQKTGSTIGEVELVISLMQRRG